MIAANWDDIKYEITCSNVIQRDNVLFAKKLSKNLVQRAKEGDKIVIDLFFLWLTKSLFVGQK